jgi:hypothetical protein
MAGAIGRARDRLRELGVEFETVGKKLPNVIDASKITDAMTKWLQGLGLVRQETDLLTKQESQRLSSMEEYQRLLEQLPQQISELNNRIQNPDLFGLTPAEVTKAEADLQQLVDLQATLLNNREQIEARFNETMLTGVDKRVYALNKELAVMQSQEGAARDVAKIWQEAGVIAAAQGDSQVRVFREIRDVWQQIQDVKASDFVAGLDRSSTATYRLASAQNLGARAIQEATVQARLEAEVLKRGERYRTQIAQALRRESSARNALQTAQTVSTMREELGVLDIMSEAWSGNTVEVVRAESEAYAYQTALKLVTDQQTLAALATDKMTLALANLGQRQSEVNRSLRDTIADNQAVLDTILQGSEIDPSTLRAREEGQRAINELLEAAAELEVLGTEEAEKKAAAIQRLAVEYENLDTSKNLSLLA